MALAAPTAPGTASSRLLPGGERTIRRRCAINYPWRVASEVGAMAREQLTEQLDAALAQVDDLTRQRDALQRQLAARAPSA
ncbi:MAG: hypothetical protein R3A51_22045 [Nannocystaceae bacterium]